MNIPNVTIIGYKLVARFICPLNDPEREPETDSHYFDGESHTSWSTIAPGILNLLPPKVFTTPEEATEVVAFWTDLAKLKEARNGIAFPHSLIHSLIHQAFYSEEELGEDFRLEFDIVPVVEITPISTESVTFNHKQ